MKMQFKNGYEVAKAEVATKAKGENNDCAVRAVANAFGVEYDVAHEFVEKQFNREKGKGTKGFIPGLKALAGTEIFPGKTVELVGLGTKQPLTPEQAQKQNVYLNEKYPKGGGTFASFTVGKFLKQHPKGSFILVVPKHALCVQDGVMIDNANHNDALFQQKGRDQRLTEAIFRVVPFKKAPAKKSKVAVTPGE